MSSLGKRKADDISAEEDDSDVSDDDAGPDDERRDHLLRQLGNAREIMSSLRTPAARRSQLQKIADIKRKLSELDKSGKSSPPREVNLSLEMIATVATFAHYGSDLMNICLAVGPLDAEVIRYTCLRNNFGYLDNCLKRFSVRKLGRNRMHANITCWMEVNTDWRKLCSKERTEDDQLSTATYENDEGQRIFRTDPLIIFNNPAVAIEFGMLDVLKHLVEEVGIDINACKWGGYRSLEKFHLLFLSYFLSSQNYQCVKSIFEYIVSREDVDVCALVKSESSNQMWEGPIYYGRDLASFEAVVRHRSFDPNRPCDMGGHYTTRPLHQAIAFMVRPQLSSDAMSIAMKKAEILLKVGADPELATHDCPSPLIYAQSIIRREGEQSEEGKACKAMISMMEKYIN